MELVDWQKQSSAKRKAPRAEKGGREYARWNSRNRRSMISATGDVAHVTPLEGCARG
jgi:hypothetical protein